MAKNAGRQNFSGQKPHNSGSGAGQPENSPRKLSIPEGEGAKDTVLDSSDARVHSDASLRPGDGRVDGTGTDGTEDE